MMRCTLVRASRWRRSPLLLVSLLSASPALAGPSRPELVLSAEIADVSSATVINLTWPDLIRLVDQHPRLSAGKFQVDAARGGVDAAGAVPNPMLEGNVGQGFAWTGGASSIEWGLAVTMPLGWIAERGSRINAAEAEVDVAMAETKALRRDILLKLRTLFWNLAYEQARVASLASLEAQTSSLVETVKRRAEKGEVRPVEATRVEIELEKVTSDLESARIALGARRAELTLWLGVPAGMRLVLVADLDTLPVAVDQDAALTGARKSHPALAVAKARTRFFAAELDTEELAQVPSFGLTGFANYELDRRAYGVGLTADLPLWNWSTGRIAQAQARLAASRKQAEAADLELATEVIDAQAACQSSVATAARFRNNVVTRSETVASTVERTYQLGEASLLEVIDARRTLLDSRRLYLSALAEAQIDCSRLEVLVGEEPK